MDKITFTCEVVSPMFMGSAYKNSLEFRPTELKASLRFWWRAMHPHLTLDKMREKEFKIFGSGNDDASKSKVRIIDFSENLSITNKNKVPHKDWSDSSAYVSGTFTITFGLVNEAIFSKNQLISLMKTASYLGGLGARSRRGMGAWRITQIDDEDVSIDPNTTLLEDIYKNIKFFSKVYDLHYNHIMVTQSKIEDRDFPYIREIFLGNPYLNVNILTKYIILNAHTAKRNNIASFNNCAGNTNFSSPIYISIIKNNGDKFYPVITLLNKREDVCISIYNQFKRIL